MQKKLKNEEFKLTREQLDLFAPSKINTILMNKEKLLKEIDGMLLPNTSLISSINNKLLSDELSYDTRLM